jgi:hypothetical protein
MCLSMVTMAQRKHLPPVTLDHIAEQYVRLVLDIGQHDPDFVDAYYGPKEWQEAAKKVKPQLTALKDRTEAIIARLKRIRISKKNTELTLRKTFLLKQLIAASAKIDMLMGTRYSFNDEAKRLYDVVPSTYSESYFAGLLKELGKKLPAGPGSVNERYQQFRNSFVIPKEKLDTVFTAAINECRTRTKRYIDLPTEESFVVEYVTNKPWSGYNWYQGNSRSIIQVNTDLPIFIDRAVDLAAHEGYPGHHVYNVLLESELLNKKGWKEFCIYPLFSPQSLIAEGSANYGIDIVLPSAERMRFEQQVLFPLAGLDPSRAAQYYEVQALFGKLAYAGNEAARGYLDGTLTKAETMHWLTTYGMFDSARAEQRIKFIEKYRSYVINYNLGQDLVRSFVQKKIGKDPSEKKRWSVFEGILSSPMTASGLK